MMVVSKRQPAQIARDIQLGAGGDDLDLNVYHAVFMPPS